MQDDLDHTDWQEPLKSKAARKIARASQGHFVVSMTYGDEVDGCGQVITFESLLEYRTCRFPRGFDPGFPSRTDPPLHYAEGVMTGSRHAVDPSSFGL